jgi:hypothetical protein
MTRYDSRADSLGIMRDRCDLSCGMPVSVDKALWPYLPREQCTRHRSRPWQSASERPPRAPGGAAYCPAYARFATLSTIAVMMYIHALRGDVPLHHYAFRPPSSDPARRHGQLISDTKSLGMAWRNVTETHRSRREIVALLSMRTRSLSMLVLSAATWSYLPRTSAGVL